MIRTCPHCSSTLFADMAVCYGCLQPLDDASVFPGEPPNEPPGDVPVPVEEPSAATMRAATLSSPIRLHVTVPGLFGYDIYLNRTEGAQLTIGCARDNNIVLPHTESRRHILRLYYARGLVWAEDCGSTQQALIKGVPLTGIRRMERNAVLEIGNARIEFVED